MIASRFPVLLVALAAACGAPDDASASPDGGGEAGGKQTKSAFHGVLTLGRDGPSELFSPSNVVDLDLATGESVQRFNGFDPQRLRGGETAYITRLGGGYFADAAVVVANEKGVTEAPIYVCPMFNHGSNRICGAPGLSPDKRQVAFTIVGGDGKLCKDNYGMFWSNYVVVRDRKGVEITRFEGFYHSAWLPDGRLLMLGSACVGAGVWIADRALGAPTRVDGDQIATPAALPAVSPDGKKVALVWQTQLWSLGLDGKHELTQLTRSDKPVGAAAWSPTGDALAVTLWDVNLPLRLIWIFKPGDEQSQAVRPVPFYPYGPMSWN